MPKKLKLRDPDHNPCLTESDASMRCLESNGFQQNFCQSHFIRYRNCRKFWHDVMVQRRMEGTTPDMPTAGERAGILHSYTDMPY
uniref:coiled-coil-helix-coiled-coil-helix domain-containing protein 7-like isoform X2 n=1 Tax=Myxine glutinosa TaxID=7769 RepID=UPI00358F1BCF